MLLHTKHHHNHSNFQWQFLLSYEKVFHSIHLIKLNCILILIVFKMSSANSISSVTFKIVLLGEGCVGKTSLVLRYCQNKFKYESDDNYSINLI